MSKTALNRALSVIGVLALLVMAALALPITRLRPGDRVGG
jgi:hypothetical protein